MFLCSSRSLSRPRPLPRLGLPRALLLPRDRYHFFAVFLYFFQVLSGLKRQTEFLGLLCFFRALDRVQGLALTVSGERATNADWLQFFSLWDESGPQRQTESLASADPLRDQDRHNVLAPLA